MRGTVCIKKLCKAASRLGYKRLALTDTNNLYGLWPFLNACRDEGISPIIGAEVTDTVKRERAFCLVEDRTGYANLCRLITNRHCDSRFNLHNNLIRFHRGLSILTDSPDILNRLHDASVPVYAALTCRPGKHSHTVWKLAKKLEITSVAVPDAYFLSPGDHKLHQLMRAIDNNTTISRLDPAETVTIYHYLTPPAEFTKRFSIWPDTVRNTLQVSERCSFEGPLTDLIMPTYKNLNKFHADRELHLRAFSGAACRYGNKLPQEVVTRLEHELKIIAEMGFSAYFLVVHDIVRPVQRTCGRGSGAASLVSYCLRITNVCPIKHNLYFERFLNQGRRDAPDIDIDFAWDEREAILSHVFEQYGEHVAMVSNHITFKPRMAIRETAKVFGLSDNEISKVTKRVPWFLTGNHKINLLNCLKTMPELRGIDFWEPWPEILQLAEKLIDTPRHLSMHPGGVVITPKPITDYVPIEPAAKGIKVIQWEKDSTEEAGLVKIDLLGNRSLAVIRDTILQLRHNRINFDENRWEPEDDFKTKQTIATGKTMGCFYIESPAMRLLQQKTSVGDFKHLVVHSSIIRPAANEYIRQYIKRLHGRSWQPLHPVLKGVLDETLGIMVYQEDVSRVALKFGFSHVDADRLRKIMSKKDKEKRLADYKKQFFDGGVRLCIPMETIEAIWKMMMSFEGYSFCKPHSASYAKVSFQAAYLKAHFPAEFMASVISNSGGYYSTFAYVSEAKRLGVKVFHPDVNSSKIAWHGHKQNLRTGLMAIKHLGHLTMKSIIRERQNHVFVSITDFLQRVKPNEKEAVSLIHAGALDNLEPTVFGKLRNNYTRKSSANRALLLYELARWQQTGQSHYTRNLFSCYVPPPELPPENRLQRLRNEYRSLGFLCNIHPITLFETARRHLNTNRAIELSEKVGQRVRFLGWRITGKIVSTRQGEPMEFITFEDETGQVECTFFPLKYKRFVHLLHHENPLLLEGIIEEDYNAITLTVERVEKI